MLPPESFASTLHCIQSNREMNSKVLMTVAMKMLSTLYYYNMLALSEGSGNFVELCS
jgi:hypothetical protein